MWTWDQSAGQLSRDGKLVSRGYSGAGRGKNNPAYETLAKVGPIPTGRYKIGKPYKSAQVGPYVLPLDSVDAHPGDDIHERTGRGAFRIHGDSIRAPGQASEGCIILPRDTREKIWLSGDRDLEVVT